MTRGPRPLLFHTHGIDNIDFSAVEQLDLNAVSQAAWRQNVDLTLTVFLRRDRIDALGSVLHDLKRLHEEDQCLNLVGFAVEGPMLGTSGGVPPAGCWTPTWPEWERIARTGPLGLRYIVIGPDAVDLDGSVCPGHTFQDLIDLFYTNGTKLALGHFQHTDPATSARRTREVIDYVNLAYGPSPHILTTDHLFNDMPRAFKHAWRTPSEKANRDQEVAALTGPSWRYDDLWDLLGPVPATIMRAGVDGKLIPVLNFDGEHVDLSICEKTVEFLGADRMIAISDDTLAAHMAGQTLITHPWSSLRFREDGRVAAGSTGMDGQMANMRRLGLKEEQIIAMCCENPRLVIDEPITRDTRVS